MTRMPIELYDEVGPDPTVPNTLNNVRYEIQRGLSASKPSFAAGGVDFVLLHYAGEEAGNHKWTVNGLVHNEPSMPVGEDEPAAGLNESSIEVTLAAPGPVIVVGPNGETITLTAT